ncbi:threalose-6-phosphate phosphatase [Sarracenia purpurea var. burkii]
MRSVRSLVIGLCYNTHRETERVLIVIVIGLKEFQARRIGWTGVNVPDEAGQRALTKAFAEKWYCFWGACVTLLTRGHCSCLTLLLCLPRLGCCSHGLALCALSYSKSWYLLLWLVDIEVMVCWVERISMGQLILVASREFKSLHIDAYMPLTKATNALKHAVGKAPAPITEGSAKYASISSSENFFLSQIVFTHMAANSQCSACAAVHLLGGLPPSSLAFDSC